MLINDSGKLKLDAALGLQGPFQRRRSEAVFSEDTITASISDVSLIVRRKCILIVETKRKFRTFS